MQLIALLTILLLPTLVFAQRGGRGGGGGGVRGGGGGFRGGAPPFRAVNPTVGRNVLAPSNGFTFGNILFPGGIPIQNSLQNSFSSRLGATIAGGSYTGVPGGRFGHGRGRSVVVPYAYPFIGYGGDYYGGGGGYYDDPNNPQNVTVVVPQPPQSSTPQVVINNNYIPDKANPTLKEYGGDSNSDPSESSNVQVYEGSRPRTDTVPAARAATSVMDQKPTIYLIALKDGTIRQAIGYWLQGDTLHYVTPASSMNHVSVAMVDGPRSTELNAERHLEFDLKLDR